MIVKAFWFLRAMAYRLVLGRVGLLSYIGRPLYIKNHRRVYLGSKVRIYPHARIEVIDTKSTIIFEDNISVGQNLHIISAGDLVIEKNTTISANVLITNVDHVYQELDKHILLQPLIIGKTHIGQNCFIGYGAVLQANTILGRQCIIGSNAVVRGTFPAYSLIVGAPAKIVKRYDKTSGMWKKTNESGDFIDE